MKLFFKKLLEKKLRFFARRIIKKYQPDVIGVTGSVGKTSTKEAIFCVLSKRFSVRRNLKNYNNEIGVPLTIIDIESGKKSLIGWFKVFFKACKLIIFRCAYPKILVLEMAADKPGDIEYLVDFVPCRVGIITAIAPVHLEFFKELENVVKEKAKIISHLEKDDFALLCADDELVIGLKDKTKASVSTYGFSDEAEIKGTEVQISFSRNQDQDSIKKQEIRGLSFKISYQGSTIPFFQPGVLGQHQAYSALAACAVGLAYGLNLSEISEALRDFKSPPGRMNLIKGIKETLIIDDSYNSSPKAAIAALEVLDKIPLEKGSKKYVALGDMAELGNFTEEGHKMIGREVVKYADILLTVGEKARMIADEAVKSEMKEENVFSFDKAEELGKFLQDRIHQNDLLLIKGSQVSRMEKVVKELMAEPLRASELLVRQGKEWN